MIRIEIEAKNIEELREKVAEAIGVFTTVVVKKEDTNTKRTPKTSEDGKDQITFGFLEPVVQISDQEMIGNVTEEECKSAFQKVIQNKSVNEAMKILAKFKAKQFINVPPEKYPEFYSVVTAALQ